MKMTTIGLDLAKHVFQVHGVDSRGEPVLRKQLKRSQMLPFFANLEPCLWWVWRPVAVPITGRGSWKPWDIP